MPPASAPRISVIIPIYGNVGDVDRLVAALNRQTLKPVEILVVDSSPKPLETAPAGTRLLRNPDDVSLSWDYNFGAKHATGDFILNMQQDCLPDHDRALQEVYEALTPDRVAVVATVSLPPEVWEKYNFWGQVLMARWIGDVKQGISGKFDLIRKEVFDRINGYDTENFSFAGEDMDLFLRLSQQGEVFVSPTRVLHLHNQSKRTSGKELFTKTFQLAESFGALFRKWRFGLRNAAYASHWTHHLAKYMYPFLPLLLVWPVPAGIAYFILSNLAYADGFKARSPKKLVLLILNPLIFVAGLLGTIRGLLTGKQRYTQNK